MNTSMAVILFILSGSAFAQDDNLMKPGLWEVGLPYTPVIGDVDVGSGGVLLCLVPANAVKLNAAFATKIPLVTDFGGCSPTKVARSTNQIGYQTICKRQGYIANYKGEPTLIGVSLYESLVENRIYPQGRPEETIRKKVQKKYLGPDCRGR